MHPKLQQLLKKRFEMSRNGQIDWGFGELLALGSLLLEGTPVRLVGQDSRRGTFVSRHAVFHDRVNGQEWLPLANLAENQARFSIYDSLLSEYAALAFEYGYSVERPDALVLWEAQFGDFANGAQTVIDEFISSAEQKWGQRSSVVMLLPHGYEGQGPDHSSARIERYLQLRRRGQHDGRPPVDARLVRAPAAPPGLRAPAAPADRLHPEVDAAAARRDERGRTTSRPASSSRCSTTPGSRVRRTRTGRPAGVAASCCTPASCTTTCSPSWRSCPADAERVRARAARAVLPAARRAAERGAASLPERRGRLGAGRAREPGRLAVHQPRAGEVPARAARSAWSRGRRRHRRRPARARSAPRSRRR